MTESYLRNITPDSLSGLVFGFEGIKNALVIRQDLPHTPFIAFLDSFIPGLANKLIP